MFFVVRWALLYKWSLVLVLTGSGGNDCQQAQWDVLRGLGQETLTQLCLSWEAFTSLSKNELEWWIEAPIHSIIVFIAVGFGKFSDWYFTWWQQALNSVVLLDFFKCFTYSLLQLKLLPVHCVYAETTVQTNTFLHSLHTDAQLTGWCCVTSIGNFC